MPGEALTTSSSVDAAVEEFLRAGAADGSLRPGIEAGDLVTLLVGVFATLPGGEDPARTIRLLELVMGAARP